VNAISVNTAFEAMDDVDSRSFEPMPRGKQRRPETRRKGNGGSGGGFQCRRNKHHTWGSGAGARLADLRAFAGAVALLLVAAAAPASAESFGVTSAPAGSGLTKITGLGRLTGDYKTDTLGIVQIDEVAAGDERSLASAFSIASDASLVGVPTAAPTEWLADVSVSADAGTLTATQLAATTVAPSQWPVASDVVSPTVDAGIVLAADVPEQFGDYANTYSTYGQWESIGETTAAVSATGDLVAVGDTLPANRTVDGGEFLLTSLDRSEGLRVAVVAVPEPSNTVAAAFALGGLIAVHMVRRRHKMVPARVLAC
jgi:hypothetical protein